MVGFPRTSKAYKHIPLLHTDDLHSVIPFDCVPVAVELIPGARPLDANYVHPERAFYVFGPEDGSIGSPDLVVPGYDLYPDKFVHEFGRHGQRGAIFQGSAKRVPGLVWKVQGEDTWSRISGLVRLLRSCLI